MGRVQAVVRGWVVGHTPLLASESLVLLIRSMLKLRVYINDHVTTLSSIHGFICIALC